MNISPDLASMQRAGFPVGAEPLVALDLADTLITVTDPATDLLSSPDRTDAWWRLQVPRLPAGAQPDPAATRRLRAALRELFDAHLQHRQPPSAALEQLNATAASVPTSPRLDIGADGARRGTHWHTEQGAGNPKLAAIAGEAINLLTDPDRLAALRRCANPNCSMFFLAATRRRVWCAANICGNRTRVARHYQRTHSSEGAS